MTPADHPGDFSNKVGHDLYVNPWWALRNALRGNAGGLAQTLDDLLGPPDLWFQGCFHELLWGPRDIPRNWRPSFAANLSGTDGRLWRHFWLPWRSGWRDGPHLDIVDTGELWPHLHSAGIQDVEVTQQDFAGLAVYCEVVNRRRLPAHV